MSELVATAARPPRPVLRPIPFALAAILLLGLGFVSLLGATAAQAREVWCASDPIIEINGKYQVAVVISVPGGQVANVREAVTTFHLPRNVKARVIYIDQTYFPQRARLVFDQPAWDGVSIMPVRIEVEVEARTNFDYNITVRDARGDTPASARSNDEVAFRAFAFLRDR